MDGEDMPVLAGLADALSSDEEAEVAKLDKERGFSSADVEVAVRVLEALGKDVNQIQSSKRYKALRQAIMPFVKLVQEDIFQHKTAEDLEAEKVERSRKAARKARQRMAKMKDREHIDKGILRAKRLEQLENALNDGAADQLQMPLIADGAVNVDEEMARRVTMTEGADGEGELNHPRSCYTCKTRFWKLHFFYDQLCPDCAELNYTKRVQKADLKGRVALVTGARVKIGYQTALKLLRSGCEVIATSRFPRDCAVRYAEEKDFGEWSHRLHVYGMDFRDLPGVERFALFVCTNFKRLDILINNACQTIRRPPIYYKHLVDKEHAPVESLPEPVREVLRHELSGNSVPQISHGSSGSSLDGTIEKGGGVTMTSAMMSQIPLTEEDHVMDPKAFPEKLDHNNQQIDLRTKNSWLLTLAEVSTPEVLEVFSINSIAPFIFNSKLKSLMEATPGDKYIVNVSAMEGKFYRFKSAHHPHTNMAKAALNMMTRTSASDYAQSSIYMNAVDTGWINDENPLEKAKKYAAQHGFQTPIDEIDAAARILDPVFVGVNNGGREHGNFYKDYKKSEW